LYQALGTPSIADFKNMIRMNFISNNPVTTEDIEIAERIFGPDIGSLKGKTTRHRPAPVINDYVEVPQELLDNHHNIILCIDTIKINNIPFLTTVSRNLQYRTAQPISKLLKKCYECIIERVFTLAKFSVIMNTSH
jgi:hypothetical protein